MAFTQNFKVQTGIGRLLTSGLVVLSMLFIIFSISCQAPTTEPAPSTEPMPTVTEEEEAAPSEEEEEKVTEEEPIPTEEPAPTPEPEPTPTPESEPSPTSTPTEIKISGFAFVPAIVTVTAGTTLTWTNLDSVAHTVTSETDLFDSGNLARNATFSYSFADRGAFSYYCAIHPSMKGKVSVE